MGSLISIQMVLSLEKETGRQLDLDLYCDNQHTVDVVNKDTPPGKKNTDIEREITFCLDALEGKVTAIYIKSHPDDHEDVAQLPEEVKAQIRCDHRARSLTQSQTSISYELFPTPLSHQTIFLTSSQGVLPFKVYRYLASSRFLSKKARPYSRAKLED